MTPLQLIITMAIAIVILGAFILHFKGHNDHTEEL